MKRNFFPPGALLLLLLSLVAAVCTSLGSLPWAAVQLGYLVLGMALERGAVFLAQKRSAKWRLAPLALLILPLVLSVWEYRESDVVFFMDLRYLVILMYGLLSLHYLAGWAAVCLMFPRKKPEPAEPPKVP